MKPYPKKSEFIQKVEDSFKSSTFNRLKISKPVNKNDDLVEIIVRIIDIKKVFNFSFLYHYKTKDITKNFNLEEGINEIKKLSWVKFKNFVLFTSENDITLSYNSKMKESINYCKPTILESVSKDHNKNKNNFIKIENNKYLKDLWIINWNNKISKDMWSKFKQINKYIETLDSIFKNSDISKLDQINIADMWCWKWYLTFSVYDHFVNNLKINTKVTWVEIRENLVDSCNSIAQKSNFENLEFVQNNINDYEIKNNDILIALHACDTATDDAIFKWITLNSSIIILSPCCHKQIRKELNVINELSDIVKHWILKERIAENVTDTLRGLIMEYHWYKTQIFEFISDWHTHKNLMIVWVKKKKKIPDNLILQKIENLKKMFWIENFYLENLFI